MWVRRGIFLLLLLAVCCVVSAGCVSNSQPVVSDGFLSQVSGADGLARGVFLNYTDEDSGNSWWVMVKSRVGSSVLSLKSPDFSITDAVFSEEKRKILADAFELSGVSPVGIFSYPGRMLSLSPQERGFHPTEYAFGIVPSMRMVALSSAEWNALLPRLKEALVKITE